MKNPKLIVKPFAKNGQKNVIPENYETSMESNQATWDQGFGQITMLPVAAGGLPPKGQDFNGIFNQISENIVYLSQGGRFKFSAEYAEAIGGYSKGATLQSDDEKKEYLSLIDNNKVNFNVAADISASWKLVNTDDLLAQIASKQQKGDYATKTELNNGLSGKQPKGNYAPAGEYALTADLDKKLDKTSVAQATGTSTTNTMSQNAITNALKNAVNIDTIYPVGVVIWFAQNKNPNNLFPGTTWSYIGENKTIRLASSSGNNVLSSGGSDNVTLTASHLPAHSHSFSGTTSSFDYGTKTTNTTGNHSHSSGIDSPGANWGNGRGTNNANQPVLNDTGDAGNHSHTVNIGSHNHTVSGNTGNSGSGASLSTINAYIMLMGWYRTE